MCVILFVRRVKGVNSLRVVDGSIIPNITSGNIEAPIIMIAEKAADMILQRISVIKKKKTLIRDEL